jgi:translation initiation factor IF-3
MTSACFSVSSMSRYHLNSVSRALYRVFVAPHPTTLHPVSSGIPADPSRFAPCIQTPIRSLHYKRTPAQRHTLADHYTVDNAIEASHINLVNEKGIYYANVSINDALRSYNRVTHHLLLVKPGTVDEFGTSDPEDLPTCRIVTKLDLRRQLQKKIELKLREETGKVGSSADAKTLELNWAIASGDLIHRLSKLQSFLKEGRKVDVTLGPKRRGKEATRDECDKVLKAVRDAVLDCKGASETKDPDGMVGGVMTLFFEGKDLSEKKPEQVKEAPDGPIRSKFREKLERKQKEEEEKRRLEYEQRMRERAPKRLVRGY